MPVSGLDIRPISAGETLPVRSATLRPEEPLAAVMVPGDAEGLHLGGFLAGELVSVASLFRVGDEARFRKFATLPSHQGRGIGQHMLARMIEDARQSGAREFWCNARVAALSIYQRAGMLPDGAPFEQDGRLYQRMQLRF